MTGVFQPVENRIVSPDQQFTGRPDLSVGQVVGASGRLGVKTLPLVALKLRPAGTVPVVSGMGEFAVAGAGAVGAACGMAEGGGGVDEKMLKLPALTPVGWVASPESDCAGCAGAGGKAAAEEAGAAVCICCAPAAVAVGVAACCCCFACCW